MKCEQWGGGVIKVGGSVFNEMCGKGFGGYKSGRVFLRRGRMFLRVVCVVFCVVWDESLSGAWCVLKVLFADWL